MFGRNIESLEGRTLFAAAPAVATIVEAGGVIDVVGTKKADDIHVRLNGDLLEVVHNNETVLGSYNASLITLVRVDGGKGHDNLHVDANVLVAAHLTGGVGNDTLVGGGGNDRLMGMQGKDNLSGGEGNDYLDGAQAPDVLSGGAGDDQLLGGHGPDTIDGGDGNDTITGGKGRDALTGGLGADVFVGDDQTLELRDYAAGEDTYTFNLNPFQIIDDIFNDFF